jgi:hypothetical protein
VADTLYKFLTADDKPTYGPESFSWPLPNGKPGDWVSVKGPLVPCENGLHLVRESGLVDWINANLYEAECKGETVEKDEHVIVCRKARLLRRVDTWDERTTRLFACDCAEHVIHFYENLYPGDVRLRYCIDTARAFANGKATEAELAAARDAAAAAWTAADAAWYVERAAADAARDAADAARAAARVAWYVERAAADAAAGAAAGAAWAAADAAAGAAADAARAAADAAAGAAARLTNDMADLVREMIPNPKEVARG